MIELFFDGKEFYKNKLINSIEDIEEDICKKKNNLKDIKLDDIIGIINQFSQDILKDEESKKIEGIAFLSQWLRRVNIERIFKGEIWNQVICLTIILIKKTRC